MYVSYYRKSISSSDIIGKVSSNFAHTASLCNAYIFNETQSEMVEVDLSNKSDAFFSKPGEFLQDAANAFNLIFSWVSSVGIFIFT